uniref:PiggyBac transposable element-derived protein domain-containing protein n=1 Tax=Sparus aurata TaxID=8175 RepID=A0A671U995_SPAAU
MPNKPARYGIKIWVACDSKSSYAWKMQVYTGKPTAGGSEKNQGMRVVLDVTEGLTGGHKTVTCDNFFTSYELGQRLLERDVAMVGTVRRNKPELPLALLASKNRQVLSSKFAFTSTTTLVSYMAKKNKNVMLMSTLHTEAPDDDAAGRRKDGKPAIVLDYNSNKGGVDNLDKVIGTYSCRRMTARWPLVIFHNIIDVSSYNAFVLWREINPGWLPGKRNKRRLFLEQLGKALVTPLIQKRERLPRTAASASVVRAVQKNSAKCRDWPEEQEEEEKEEDEEEEEEAAEEEEEEEQQQQKRKTKQRKEQQQQQPMMTTTTTTTSSAVSPPGTHNKRKRCQICPAKKDRKTQTVCSGCKTFICKGCTLPYCPTCAHFNLGADTSGGEARRRHV